MTQQLDLHIDTDRITRELDELAALSSSPPPGVTRVLWGEQDVAARGLLRGWCAEAGLEVREDALGNLFARWPGAEPGLAPVASGSHTDAIPNAGRYDGTVGVVGALEALRALRRAGFQPRRALELLMFTAEEPTRFGIGCLGSRALAGALDPPRLTALRDAEGRSLGELRRAAGYAGDLGGVRLREGAYAAFVELHIEQGPLLERAGDAIGIVEHIAAPASLRLRLTGEGGHAGAVLMPDRRDALLAGAEIALAVERAALDTGSRDSVATTGVFAIQPGAVNSVPAAALLECDVRDTDGPRRDAMVAVIEREAAAICARRGVDLSRELLNADPPAACDTSLVDLVEQVCRELGLASRRMVSRAYHDSLFMARICPTTMIFIPCRAGVSHRPDEYAAPEHIAAGVAALAHTLARLAA
jgi:N-carbamoyl-L-amino-acid hydrolase